MQFTLPYQDVLTIPSGAGPGDPRVVIDGTTGRIEIYDNNGDLMAYIDDENGYTVVTPGDPPFAKTGKLWIPTFTTSPALSFTPEDGYTDAYSGITDNVYSTLGAKRYFLEIASAIINGGRSTIRLYSSRVDTFASTVIVLDALDVQIPEAGELADPASKNSLPRGVRARVDATADDALAATTEELFNICVIDDQLVEAGRRYEVSGQVSFSAVTARVIFRLRYTEDGTTPTTASPVLGSSVYFTTGGVGTTGGTGRIVHEYIPATQLNFSVGLFLEASVAITAIGTGDQHAYIQSEDKGST